MRGAELRVHLPARPRHLLVAGLHGEEPETVQLARGVLDRVDAADAGCAIVLCANPDGVADGTRQNARGVDLNRNFPAASWREGTTRSYPAGIDPAERVPGQPPQRLLDRLRAALRARERGAGGADRAPRARARARPARAARARADDAARAGRDRARARRRRGARAHRRARLARAGRAARLARPTAACPASPTRSSTRACRRCTRGTCPGLVGVRHANARNVARLIATVSSMRSA